MEKKMVCKTEVYLNRVLRTSFISQVGHSLYHHHNHRHTLIMKSRRRIITSFPKETHKNERKRGMQLRRVNWKRPTEHIFLSSLLFLDREQEWEWGWRCRWQTFKPQVWKGGFRSNLLLFSLFYLYLSFTLDIIFWLTLWPTNQGNNLLLRLLVYHKKRDWMSINNSLF